ncbi:MAG TPA: DUF4149 domain-containing protein [Gallionellaceae bacterium]|nr:DUF4149 domain-containing protein [Gallionellaceae bacterium]
MNNPLRNTLAAGIGHLAITLWVGSLWGVGFLAVPILFEAQPDKMLAGMLAGKMFTLISYLGIACALYLLAWFGVRPGRRAVRDPLFLIVAAMLLLVLVSQFGLQPQMAALKALAHPGDVTQSVYASRFNTLHHTATALYIGKALLGAALVLISKTRLIFSAA